MLQVNPANCKHAFFFASSRLWWRFPVTVSAAWLVVRIFGCMPPIQDEGTWPAFTYLICAEASKFSVLWTSATRSTYLVVVVLMTLFKRYLDPVTMSTRMPLITHSSAYYFFQPIACPIPAWCSVQCTAMVGFGVLNRASSSTENDSYSPQALTSGRLCSVGSVEVCPFSNHLLISCFCFLALSIINMLMMFVAPVSSLHVFHVEC